VLWFGVAMATSVGKTFRTANASAYNLALGLLVSWLPLLNAYDRNPTNSRHAPLALQQFLPLSRGPSSMAGTLALILLQPTMGNQQHPPGCAHIVTTICQRLLWTPLPRQVWQCQRQRLELLLQALPTVRRGLR
jgi:hypothetical protein